MNTRLMIFVGILTTMSLLEFFFPRRPSSWSRWQRCPANLSLSLISQLIIKFGLISFSTIVVANWSQENQWGLFHWVGVSSLPLAVQLFLTLIILDLIIYWQHRFFHILPIFWKFHRVHHTDGHLDATSALRFHPIEIILSYFLKLLFIVVLGVSPLGIIVFEITLNGTAIFNHANFKIPENADKFLRSFLVTPDMHRVHHSKKADHRNTNFGFNLPWWDYLFGSYTKIPYKEQEALELGVEDCPINREQGLLNLILQPFRK